ncbi:amidohydrolase family protein [Herbiconiux sp.]|uniref:metal-dependent hydrolase family protein n=1 Tax=Herbiconiux sp. TaxID=1871186 RepID=UPI0025C46A24|nr:amidohydrolase family protein [Herbiconiux sp.]
MSHALDGITVWNGTRLTGPARLEWTGDRITGVGPAEDRHPGLAVIPGLIDTHVHLDTSVLDGAGPGDAWPLVTPPEEKAMHVAAHALRFASFGVTTMRDLAATPIQIAVGRAFDQGVLEGPRLLSSGPVGMTAGHGDLFTPPRHRDRPPVADSPDECRRLVRQWAREGATGIKIYTSGGIFSMGDHVGWRNQTRAEIAATVDEAHALRMLVAAHSHTAEGIDIALEEGVDSIEHATGIRTEQFAALVAANMPVSPTLLINDLVAAGGDGIRAEASGKAREVVAGRDPAFLAAARAGVRFVLGTDANGRFVRHGGQLDELRAMRSAFDWSAERTLVSATSDAADSLGLGDRLGRLEEGHAADFVVVRGRPWDDLAELTPERIVAVVSRGRVLSGALPG